MPRTPHVEKHFTSTDTVRDIVIGMSDGLTVPFALAAGLTGAIVSSRIVVTAGLAEIVAGSIAMGLGGYLAARGDAEHYASERRREEREIETVPDVEAKEVAEILETYGLTEQESLGIVAGLQKRPEAWIEFMMRFELGLEKPAAQRAVISAATIAGAYIAGGFIPLAPYFFIPSARHAVGWSVLATLLALLIFGYAKGRATGTSAIRNALQTVLVGGLAAGFAFIIARAVSGVHHP